MLLSILKRALFLAGAGMLGYAIFTIVDSYAVQRYKTAEFDRTLTLPANLRAEPQNAVAGQAIGKLTIPSIGFSAIVLEGADDGTLRIAPGHIPGTALPGKGGNVAIRRAPRHILPQPRKDPEWRHSQSEHIERKLSI